jgi:hypothetical protein
MDWLLDQLDPALDDFDAFLRPDTMTRVFGRSYSRHLNPIQRREAARAGIRVGLRPWLGGEPLTALEAALSAFVAAHEGPVARPTKPDKMAKRARRFAMRLAPDLGFLCGVLSQVAEKMWSDAGLTAPPMTGFLPTLIRRGFQTPYHFALAREAFHAARPAVEVWFEGLSADLSQDPADTWLTVRDKLSIAQAKQSFEEITPEQLEAFLSAVRESAITLD